MPKYTTVTKNGIAYKRCRKTVGKRKNKKGEWVPYTKDFYGRTVKELEQKIAEYESNSQFSQNRCLGEVMEQWITDVFSVDSTIKDSTKNRYLQAYRANIADAPISGMLIDEITAPDLQRAFNDMTCGASTKAQAKKLLRRFFKYAVSNEIASRDITGTIVLPKAKSSVEGKQIVTWSEAELKAIKEGFIDHRYEFLAVLLMSTGARISELLALTYDDFIQDKETGGFSLSINKQLTEKLTIGSTKTNSSVRSIPLSNETMNALHKHHEWHAKEQAEKGYTTKYVFTTDSGRFIDRHNLDTSFKRVYRKIGVQFHGFHVYRHTVASMMASKGAPIQTVSALLGHDSVTTTSRYYVNVSSKDKQSAVALLDF